MGGFPGRDRVSPTANVWNVEDCQGLRNHRKVGQAGANEDSLWTKGWGATCVNF